jgi:hypothetical protein
MPWFIVAAHHSHEHPFSLLGMLILLALAVILVGVIVWLEVTDNPAFASPSKNKK